MALNVFVVRENYDTTQAAAVESLLTGRGDTVTQGAGAPGDWTGYDLAIVADPASATAAAFAGVPVVVLGEDQPDMDLCGSSSGFSGTDIDVLDADHPIAVAAGLSAGVNTIAASAGTIERADPGTLGAGADAIAESTTSTSGRIVLYAYEQGAALYSGDPAPYRRVMFGLNAPQNYNTLGEDTFLACCDWAAGVLGGSPTTTVEIDQSDPQSVQAGDTLQLSATVTDGDGSTTWSSDDEAVATVDSAGLVTGVAEGSCSITATNNGVSDSITVNVTPADVPVTLPAPDGVRLAAGALTVTVERTFAGTARLDGVPQADVLVYLIDRATDAVVDTATTDAQGEYQFTAVPPGSYHIVPELDGATGAGHLVEMG